MDAFADSASWRLIAAKILRCPASDFSGRPSTCIDLSRVSRSRSNKNIEHLQHYAVPRLERRRSEIRHPRQWSIPQEPVFFLALQDLFHFRNFVSGSVRGLPRRQRRFPAFCGIQKFADHRLLALQSIRERIDQRISRNLPNDGASPLPRSTKPINSRPRIASRIELRLT